MDQVGGLHLVITCDGKFITKMVHMYKTKYKIKKNDICSFCPSFFKHSILYSLYYAKRHRCFISPLGVNNKIAFLFVIAKSNLHLFLGFIYQINRFSINLEFNKRATAM